LPVAGLSREHTGCLNRYQEKLLTYTDYFAMVTDLRVYAAIILLEKPCS